MHALFVAYHFPPEGSSSGVLRTLKYALYLPAHRWTVTVVSIDVSAYACVDHQSAASIPDSVDVIRTPYLDSKRHLAVRGSYLAATAIPDRWVGWYPWAVRAGERAIRQKSVDLIYATAPVPTALLVGRRLAQRHRLPLVVDLRDPWYEEPPEPGTPWIVHQAARILERRTLAAAARVTTTTDQITELLRRRYPDLPPSRFQTIMNGFDEADFGTPNVWNPHGRRALTLLHAGGINPQYRDPAPLLHAIRTAANHGLLDASKLRLRLLGPGTYGHSAELARALEETGLAEQVEVVRRQPYGDALAAMQEADVCLLLQASADTVGLIPAKLFEYLRSGVPVLALVYPGASADLLSEIGGGWSVDPRDEKALVGTLAQIYASWSAGELHAHAAAADLLARYDRRNLTRQLARLFDECVREHGRGDIDRL